MNSFFLNSITLDDVSQLPRKQFEGKIIMTDSLSSLRDALKMMDGIKLLGFDTETKPAFKKGHSHKAALLQLAADDTCFIFRLNKIGFPDELISLLCNKSITKIGLAIKDDYSALSKLKNINPAGFIDLQKYAENFGIEDKSLKKLAAITLGIRISKSQQTSNWETPTLSESQLIYAATDAWICLQIYKRLKEMESQYGSSAKSRIKIR
jgi:ribonuclease D